MAKTVLMPQIGISVESCIITQWQKATGDIIAVGDILFSYETDKSSLECESTAEGTLLEIFYEGGDEVPVLFPVCAIGTKGEDVSHLRPQGEQAAPPAAPTEVAAPPVAPPVAPPATDTPATQGLAPAAPPVAGTLTQSGRISPRARRLALDQKIDTSKAIGTGPYGRVVARDIRTMAEQGIGRMTSAALGRIDGAALGTETGLATGTALGGRVGVYDLTHGAKIEQAATEPAYREEKFSGIRKAISRSMSHSLASIPQLTHNHSFDASAIMAYRKELKAGAERMGLPNITLTDIILYAVSRTLLEHPGLNAHMVDGETIRYHNHVHLGMAVDTPRGLMVPVIAYADLKTLAEISAEAKELAQAAIEGSLSPDRMTGGTFTVSNLGTLGVESFTPVINPPETGILGIDNIITRVRELEGEITTYPAMGLSLTYDHRAIDGAPASRFAKELCQRLEHFTTLLAR